MMVKTGNLAIKRPTLEKTVWHVAFGSSFVGYKTYETIRSRVFIRPFFIVGRMGNEIKRSVCGN